jgi:8-oxo-dGTP pyrophosphatase MutT (NUDIX family)
MRWDVIRSEITYRCRIFSVRRDESRSPRSGRAHDFHVLETPDFVNVIPLTGDGRVLLVRQFRHGIRELTLEVPAGLVDGGEAPEAAARRELREETGYTSLRIEPLGVVHPNPAIMNNRCHMFVAYEVEQVGPPQWDVTEELGLEAVALGRVPHLIRSGAVSNALTVTAFHLLELVSKHP